MENIIDYTEILQREKNFFFEHLPELIEKYYGTYIVIVGEKVIGAYVDELNAYEYAKKQFEPGTFLIQLCVPKNELGVLRFSTPFIYV